VYVVLAGVTGAETAEVRITFNPLVWWVWVGGIVMALGGLIVMWPQAERRRTQSGYVAVLAPRGAPGAPSPRAARPGAARRAERIELRARRAPRPRRAGVTPPRSSARRRRRGRGRGLAAVRRAGAASARRTRRSRRRRTSDGRERLPAGHARPQVERHPAADQGADGGARAAARLRLPVHARRLHLPHHRLLVRHLAADAPRRAPPGGGRHSGDEIIQAFERVYGEAVLMAPKREGFNLAGYWMPFAALGTARWSSGPHPALGPARRARPAAGALPPVRRQRLGAARGARLGRRDGAPRGRVRGEDDDR
jgi:hypothetical protein